MSIDLEKEFDKLVYFVMYTVLKFISRKDNINAHFWKDGLKK